MPTSKDSAHYIRGAQLAIPEASFGTEVTANCSFHLTFHVDCQHWTLRLKHKEMPYTQWKSDRLCLGLLFTPSHVAIARLFEGGELKALIERRGTSQKSFYTIRRFRQGVRSEATGRFTLGEAKAAAENPQTN